MGSAHYHGRALFAALPAPHPAAHLADVTYQRILGPLGEKRTVWAQLQFADPIADIAVLGSPDDQELSEQAEAYERLLGSAHPLPIVDPPARSLERVRIREEWIERYAPGRGAVRLLSLDGKWIKARVLRHERCLTVEPQTLVVSGMSGSPILSQRHTSSRTTSMGVDHSNLAGQADAQT
jgi:hypothetical protein